MSKKCGVESLRYYFSAAKAGMRKTMWFWIAYQSTLYTVPWICNKKNSYPDASPSVCHLVLVIENTKGFTFRVIGKIVISRPYSIILKVSYSLLFNLIECFLLSPCLFFTAFWSVLSRKQGQVIENKKCYMVFQEQWYMYKNSELAGYKKEM